MADEDELDELFVEGEVSKLPEGKPADGTRTRHRRVSKAEAKSRKELVEALLINGVPEHRIETTLREQYPRTRKGDVSRLIAAVRARWAEEEKTNRPHFKSAAQRRLYAHIAKAASEKNFAAVAALERLLSDVQGTKEPLELNLNLDATVSEAVMHVVANLSAEEMDRIMLEQREMRTLAAERVKVLVQAEAELEKKH